VPTSPEPSPAVVDLLPKLPKVLLHDHLDGGLRPGTVAELAERSGYEGLPTTDPAELGGWFRSAADSGSLERYLETFAHTVAVMQTADALRRVAAECAQDLAADGVVYAEVRYAPEQHLAAGLSLVEVVEAVQQGFRDGERAAAAAGQQIRVGTLVTAMRHAANGMEIARLAVRFRDEGVVGFDIAGAEAGFPPTRHLDAFEYLRRENAHFTIHAGEAFGLPSIWEAIQWCGADRLGHGVRIVDDLRVGARPYGSDPAGDATAQVPDVALGRLAAYVRDRRIPLEMCPSSNVQTGAAPSIAAHPIGLLARLRFRVTLNTDNRLMSGTSMSREMRLMVQELGWGLDDLRWVTVNAMKSAFLPFDERLDLIDRVIKPGYARFLAPLDEHGLHATRGDHVRPKVQETGGGAAAPVVGDGRP
jgi:adenosine deaminase